MSLPAKARKACAGRWSEGHPREAPQSLTITLNFGHTPVFGLQTSYINFGHTFGAPKGGLLKIGHIGLGWPELSKNCAQRVVKRVFQLRSHVLCFRSHTLLCAMEAAAYKKPSQN